MRLELLEKGLASGDLIGKKAANRIAKASTNLQQNNSHTATNDQDKEKISKERYISPKERQKIIDDLRLI